MAVGVPESVFNYSHIVAAGTTSINVGPVVLHNVVSNLAVAGTATIIDGTAATDAARATVAVVNENIRITHNYDVELGKGLIVVTTGAAPSVTVSWVKV